MPARSGGAQRLCVRAFASALEKPSACRSGRDVAVTTRTFTATVRVRYGLHGYRQVGAGGGAALVLVEQRATAPAGRRHRCCARGGVSSGGQLLQRKLLYSCRELSTPIVKGDCPAMAFSLHYWRAKPRNTPAREGRGGAPRLRMLRRGETSEGWTGVRALLEWTPCCGQAHAGRGRGLSCGR